MLQIINKNRIVLLLTHTIVWIALFLLPVVLMFKPITESGDLIYWKLCLFASLHVVFFYTNFYLLIPKYLLKKKILKYVLSVSAVLIIYIFGQSYFYPFNFDKNHFKFDKRPESFKNRPPGFDPFQEKDINQFNTARKNPEMNDKDFYFHDRDSLRFNHIRREPSKLEKAFFFIKPGTIPFSMLILFLSIGIKMIIEWYRNERQKDVLEKEKLNAELAFLKSQVNPHFIFNVLNNICSLARKKSDDTENAIIKLSQLLRYNLYDFKNDKVSLEREIQYINDYIDIQKMRLSENVNVIFNTGGNIENVMIEPLIFIPFVENAFKHGVNTVNKCKIEISITSFENVVNLIVKNNKIEKKQNDENTEGIGLKNVLRRLNLLYPNKHRIDINDSDNEYIVDLKITLND